MTCRVLFLGAGHAHHHALAHISDYLAAGCEVTLVADGPFWYSGMATGMLGGVYRPQELQINVADLVERGGGRHIDARVALVLAQQRRVRLENGEVLSYDLLSVALGSVVESPLPAADPTMVYLVKPLARLWQLRQKLERSVMSAPRVPLRVVVIGGGHSACEVAANAHTLIAGLGGYPRVTVIAGDAFLAQSTRRARLQVTSTFARRGITIVTGRALRIGINNVEVAGGAPIPSDVAVITTGLSASPVLSSSGLACDEGGALTVDQFLRSPTDPRVFGGGDVITFNGSALPRLGVFAVRQGPVLHHNLLATVRGLTLRPFCPQRRWLSIMNLGERMGVATWGPLTWSGRLAWRLKDHIDRRFIDHYR